MKSLLSLRALAAACLLGLVAASAQAGEAPFDAAAFDAAVAAGKPAAVHFHADWCPTCRAQAPLLRELMSEPRFKDLTLFVADYDRESALKRRLKVTQQSTLVVFKEGREAARSTGQTRKEALAELLGKAL